MRLLGEVLSLATRYLQERRVISPRLVAETLLAHTLQKKRIELYMHFDLPLKEEELIKFRLQLKEAAMHKPVEYIIQEVEFYGCTLHVSEDVLIPRGETEVLVDRAVQAMQSSVQAGERVADLCAGSGCIGLSVKKKFPYLEVLLVDNSKKALAVCKRNAGQNGLDVEFLEGDFLQALTGKKFSYVFCNPPYVTLAEYEELDVSVRGFEPRAALVGGARGVEFYERIAQELPAHLLPGAKVFLELGKDQGNSVKEIFAKVPFWKKGALQKDFAGHDRFFFLEIE